MLSGVQFHNCLSSMYLHISEVCIDFEPSDLGCKREPSDDLHERDT